MLDDEVMEEIGYTLTDLVKAVYKDDRGFIFITASRSEEQGISYISNIDPTDTIELLEQIRTTLKTRHDHDIPLDTTVQ